MRITNVSEEVTEQDLRELCGRLGRVTRVFIGKDYNTGASRGRLAYPHYPHLTVTGFAFVTYSTSEEATKAMVKLDGYGYASLILRVEKAKPRI